ncbi:MAG: hypothetical protein QGH15_20950, partial [Kiritimatiellia bacterium]|nr:hypothetical protein [Kiritimatiellia bacterium]
VLWGKQNLVPPFHPAPVDLFHNADGSPEASYVALAKRKSLTADDADGVDKKNILTYRVR